jgi:maltooligosyltrehalose trehalohydrolase
MAAKIALGNSIGCLWLKIFNRRRLNMHIGTSYQYGLCSFSVWAPNHNQVTLKFTKENQHFAMEKAGGGYWTFTLDGLDPKTEYMYALDGRVVRPDPASNFQPSGVFGPSSIIDHESFRWTDGNWLGLEIKDLVFYELHVGTFTPKGTFRAVLERIKELGDFGINSIELMPITQFSGKRNWGYDGVFPFSVHNDYGEPDDLKSLINECHKNGIGVFIDLVYNHLGPEGNYLNDFGPYFPSTQIGYWGPTINLDGDLSEGVRNYFYENALFWFNNYHIDGVRLDAVLSMKDNRPTHFLQELNNAVDGLCESTGKKLYLIAESGYNVPSVLMPVDEGGLGFDGQWLDDFQHAVFGLLTGEKEGYYRDYGKIEDLLETLNEGYLYIGQENDYKRRGSDESYRWIPASKFIVFSQNHDQVGNRLLGDRLTSIGGLEAAKLAAGLVILSPYVPLLFMGEEYAETAPFLFFTDYSSKDLAASIIDGRKKEFATFHWSEAVPNPQSLETFMNSKLNWQQRYQGIGQKILSYYRALIEMRNSHQIFKSQENRQIKNILNEGNIIFMLKKHEVTEAGIIANCSSKPVTYTFPFGDGIYTKILDSADSSWNGPGPLLPTLATRGDEHMMSGFNLAVFLKESKERGSFN